MKITEELDSKGFFRTHKSFVVNLSHIRKINRSEQTLVITNGDIIPVGNRKMKDLAAAVIKIRR